MIDTGASWHSINPNVVERAGLQASSQRFPGSSPFGRASASTVRAGFYFDGANYPLLSDFLVLESGFIAAKYDLVLGMSLLDDCRVNISRKKNLVEFGADVALPELGADARKEDGFFDPIFSGQQPNSFSPMLNVSVRQSIGRPGVQARALIDTGAELCVVSKRLVRSLDLKRVGTTDVAGVNGKSTLDTYEAVIVFPTARRAAIVVCAASNFEEFYDLIIGWNVLGNWSLHFSIKDDIIRLVSDPLT